MNDDYEKYLPVTDMSEIQIHENKWEYYDVLDNIKYFKIMNIDRNITVFNKDILLRIGSDKRFEISPNIHRVNKFNPA